MSQNWYQDVLDFHTKFGCAIGNKPSMSDPNLLQFRYRLAGEEWDELMTALSNRDLPKTVDSICDLIYVLIGMSIAFGVDLRPCWDAVQQTNMAKVGGGRRLDGKILKPEGWTPPDIEGLLLAQGDT